MNTKPLPHTQCVKGKYWYFRAPKTKELIKLKGQPGEPLFMMQYRRLMESTGAKLKRQKQRQRIRYAQQRASRGRSSALVYFIGVEPDGPIKIGIALDVQTRLGTLQVGIPMPLKVLATCEGGRAKEKEYHARFEHAHIRGEWFERVPDLLAELSVIGTERGDK
jgi:hypothetical protein